MEVVMRPRHMGGDLCTHPVSPVRIRNLLLLIHVSIDVACRRRGEHTTGNREDEDGERDFHGDELMEE